MINTFLIIAGKFISSLSHVLNLGHGSTWPGHIAISINKNFIKAIINKNPHLKIILIAGTNGKTTTAKLIRTILEKSGKKVFQNESGANLLNGISSTLIHQCNEVGIIDKDFGIFEIDENTLPLILKELTPDYIILLNLFRDQLDRYGEVNTVALKWGDALKKLEKKTTLILNADDPQIAYLGFYHIVKAIPIPYRKRSYASVLYFGMDDKKFATSNPQHAVDSTYCPNCGLKLYYSTIYYSHLGVWDCSKCKVSRPKLDVEDSPNFPLVGVYNRYNILAAVLLASLLDIPEKVINSALHEFQPAFGRQEILNIDGKKAQLFLSKNPTSFNESLRTITELKAKNLLIVLNDRIPDGRDVSWIWDVDTEEYIKKFNSVVLSGDRAFDMGLRIKYSSEFIIFNFQFSMKNSNLRIQIEENLKKAIILSLQKTPKSETLYILPTYSAMLAVRKILTGKKIS